MQLQRHTRWCAFFGCFPRFSKPSGSSETWGSTGHRELEEPSCPYSPNSSGTFAATMQRFDARSVGHEPQMALMALIALGRAAACPAPSISNALPFGASCGLRGLRGLGGGEEEACEGAGGLVRVRVARLL